MVSSNLDGQSQSNPQWQGMLGYTQQNNTWWQDVQQAVTQLCGDGCAGQGGNDLLGNRQQNTP